MKERFGVEIEVIKRSDGDPDFRLPCHPQVVGGLCTFGWLNWYRRLSKDDEGHPFLARGTFL